MKNPFFLLSESFGNLVKLSGFGGGNSLFSKHIFLNHQPLIRNQSPFCSFLLFFMAMAWTLCLVGSAWSEEDVQSKRPGLIDQLASNSPPPGDPNQEGSNLKQTLSEDDIRKTLEKTKPQKKSVFDRDLFNFYQNLWEPFTTRLQEKLRLDLGIAYTALYQRASEGPGPREGSGGDLDILGSWHLIGRKEDGNQGIFAFRGEWRHKYINIPPSQLRSSIGSSWSTTSGFNEQDFTLKEVWWEQHLFGDRFIVRGGKVDQGSYLDVFRYQSANTGFSNFAFSDRPTIALPGQGLGIMAGYFPTKDIYIGAEIGDANGKKTLSGFNTIKEEEFFSAAEVGFTPQIPGLGKGKYHMSAWHIDARKKKALPSGDGFAVNLLQEIGNGLVPFIRYAYADKGNVALRHLLTFGLGIEKPLGRTSDLMGIAFAWSKAQDKALSEQSVFEIFYRLQLTPHTQITPDFQVILNPSNAPAKDAVAVFGIRFRIAY